MDAMFAAIRKRQGKGVLNGDHMATHGSDHADVGGDKDLHGLVAGLSEDEKHTLKNILAKDSGDQQAVAKGEPSSEEKSKIAARASEENAQNVLRDEDTVHDGTVSEDQSDEIAKSMLDNRNKSGPMADKPRNLGDRMKQSLAGKLKMKGKI